MINQDILGHRKYQFGILAFLAAVVFTACFLKIRQFGIYGDDWRAGTYLFAHNLPEALKMWWSGWGGEVSNFRPLAVMLPILWYGSFKLAGFVGVFLISYFLYLGVYWLTFVYLREYVSVTSALAAVIFFVLFPANNFYLWQVTATYPLALIFVLTAVYYYRKDRRLISLLPLAMSLLINEGVVLLFFAALIPASAAQAKSFWQDLKRWVKFTGGILFIYAILRVVTEKLFFSDVGRATHILSALRPVRYVFQFFQSLFVVTISSWAFAAWKVLHDFNWQQLVPGLLVGALCFVVLYFFRFRHQPPVAAQSSVLFLLLGGVALVFAGRYYGFYYVPSINVLNLDSRYYFAASFGGVVIFAAVFEWLLLKLQQKGWMLLVLVSAIFVFLTVFKQEVQNDFARSWQSGREFWQNLLAQVPSLSPSQVLIVDLPSRPLGTIVGVEQAVGDIRWTIPYIYGPKTFGLSFNYANNTTHTSKETCITSPPYGNFCTDAGNIYYFKWDGSRLVNYSNSFKLSDSAVRQFLPDNLKAALKP